MVLQWFVRSAVLLLFCAGGLSARADEPEPTRIASDREWRVVGFDIGSRLSINAQAYLGQRSHMGNFGYRVLPQDDAGDDVTGKMFKV